MLKYLWMVTQDLFLPVTFVSLMHAVLERKFGKKGLTFHWTGIITGILASAVLAWFKNTSNLIISSHWNHVIYGIIMGFTAAFILLLLPAGQRKREFDSDHLCLGEVFLCLAGTGLSASWIFFRLPGVMGYPFNFNTMGNGYWSWYYMQRLLGWALALIILAIYAYLLYECALQIKDEKVPTVTLILGAAWNAFYCFCYFFVPFVSRAKWLKWPIHYSADEYGWIRKLTQFASRNSMLFVWTVAVMILVMAILFFAENTKITEPYNNSAQHRKLRAKNRRHRRLAVVTAVFLAAIAMILSAVKGYDTRVIELSPPETYTVENEEILIPMETVSDGHLHRFEYQTEKGVNIRWIVVKKPGSASFGTGLDACEVCGNAGYFERNGQIVCRRCDVVMNINTIGFKGGCNPIPITYEVRDGNLVFQLAEILAGEREFR